MEEKNTTPTNCTDHMANERTFLAWMRTSLGIMAFGFVVEKFALFLKQIGYFYGNHGQIPSAIHSGYSSIFGCLLIGLGALIGLLSFFKYKKDETHINENTYQSSSALAILLTVSVVLIGIFLMSYLIGT